MYWSTVSKTKGYVTVHKPGGVRACVEVRNITITTHTAMTENMCSDVCVKL